MYKIIKTIHKNLLIFFLIDFVKLQLKQVLKDKIPLDTLNSCVDYLKNKNIIDVSKSNINDYKNIPLILEMEARLNEWTNKP